MTLTEKRGLCQFLIGMVRLEVYESKVVFSVGVNSS